MVRHGVLLSTDNYLKITLYKAIIESVSTYDSETWTINKINSIKKYNCDDIKKVAEGIFKGRT